MKETSDPQSGRADTPLAREIATQDTALANLPPSPADLQAEIVAAKIAAEHSHPHVSPDAAVGKAGAWTPHSVFSQEPIQVNETTPDLIGRQFLYILAGRLEHAAQHAAQHAEHAFVMATPDAFEWARRLRTIGDLLENYARHSDIFAVHLRDIQNTIDNYGATAESHKGSVSKKAERIP